MFEAKLNKLSNKLNVSNSIASVGKVTQAVGLVIESLGPKAPVGEVCTLKDKAGNEVAKVEVVGFRDNKILSMTLGEMNDIMPGMEIYASGRPLTTMVSETLLGRVLDGLGEPLDDLGELNIKETRSIYANAPNPLSRERIKTPLKTGIRALDGLLTLGKGQRVGIFAGSGVGKSTLLGMLARSSNADVNVIALVGERGREVRDFIEKDLGPEGLERSVVVVATSDAPALVRVKAPLIATTIAEYFRDRDLDVMLMMDSVTRLAMAQREVGLTIGEPPTTKGYTPSVFSLLQKTMERAGCGEKGSITALYTVLVDADDMNEPIADAARGILDGHIVLSRKIASSGHYPAIDVLESVSRLMSEVANSEHKKAAMHIKDMMATYKDAEDLISVGAYQKGTNQRIDRAIALNDRLRAFLRQQVEETTDYDETVRQIIELAQSN